MLARRLQTKITVVGPQIGFACIQADLLRSAWRLRVGIGIVHPLSVGLEIADVIEAIIRWLRGRFAVEPAYIHCIEGRLLSVVPIGSREVAVIIGGPGTGSSLCRWLALATAVSIVSIAPTKGLLTCVLSITRIAYITRCGARIMSALRNPVGLISVATGRSIPSGGQSHTGPVHTTCGVFALPARLILASVVKMVMADQTVTFSRDSGAPELSVDVTGGGVTCDKAFEIPLMTVEHEIVELGPLLSIEPEAEICMTSKHLAELVSQFEMFDKVMEFRLSEDNVELSAKGEAGSMTARLDIEGGHLIEYAIDEGLEFVQAFCLRYVKLMACFGPVAAEVKLRFYDQKPMFMSYQLGAGSALTLMLAPRV